MPSDPNVVFLTTYANMIASGATSGAAQLAAQTAMASALTQQNSRSSVVAMPVQAVQSGRVVDTGPVARPKRSR